MYPNSPLRSPTRSLVRHAFALLAAIALTLPGSAAAQAGRVLRSAKVPTKAAAPAAPCCNVTAVNTRTGLVSARAKSGGRTFTFQATATLARGLRVGQSVWADFKTNKVSLNGIAPCCSIRSVGAATTGATSSVGSRASSTGAKPGQTGTGSMTAGHPTFRSPAIDPRSLFKPYGDIATVSGLNGTAKAASAASSSAPAAVQFNIPAALNGRVKPGQPVWINLAGDSVAFVQFPISVPNTRTVVGRGAGKGKFYVETRDLTVSNTGLITGRMKVLSEDYVSGFTGAAWIRLMDADRNVLDAEQLKCIGVNARSGDEQSIDVSISPQTAVKVRKVELWQMNSSCGRDRTQAFLHDADQAADVAGKIVKVAAAIFGGG